MRTAALGSWFVSVRLAVGLQNKATNKPVHSTRRAEALGRGGSGGPLRGAEVARDEEGSRGRRGKR